MNKSLKAGIVGLILGLAGCASQPQTNVTVEREELKVDSEVLHSMTVTELFEERIRQPDGTSVLQVQFAVQAHSDADLAWKANWFDAQGMTVKGVGEGYRKASVLMGQTRYFKATAPHPKVTTYQLHLREPQ